MTVKVGLDSEGIGSDAFTDPLEALKHFSRHPDDYLLVLSDIRMPLMSGFELVRQIRSIRPETKAILMTAFEIDASEFAKVFPSTKVDDFLQKPFSMSALSNVILKYTNQSEKEV